jgi:circadian clock protein KaiB
LKNAKIIRARRAAKKLPAKRRKAKCVLHLFLAGASARSRAILQRVSRLCAADPSQDYQLEVIDIYQEPARARASQIIATPTLVREFPRPARRFIGSRPDLTLLFGESDLAPAGKAVA